MNTINIRALAKELSLSISTVSKALKDSHEISTATKQRVLTVAQKFNYNPNPYASSLRRKKSNTIAVIVPEVADSFFSLAIKGVEEIAQSKGYHVLIYLTYESYLKEKKILEEARNGRVDGLLISVSSETTSTNHIKDLDLYQIPIVTFDRVIEEPGVAKIMTNDEESSYEATKHLIDSGCTNICYLSISKHLGINNKRIEGFKNALNDHGITWSEDNIVNCSHDLQSTYQILTALFKRNNNPDGIIAGVEKLITPIYLVCNDLNIEIPAKLKVVSFSNLPTAQILNPAITTVTQPAFEMGKLATSLLFKAIDKKGYNIKNETIILPSKLCIRDSTSKGNASMLES
jgi:LacI family transcriptional regulator